MASDNVGDFYIDRVALAIYGPKQQSTWGNASSLMGATGPSGRTMLNGDGPPNVSLGLADDYYYDKTASFPASVTCRCRPRRRRLSADAIAGVLRSRLTSRRLAVGDGSELAACLCRGGREPTG